ncbi:MAG TPA: hypothetical protein VHM28_08930 [Anaerolineales bacterium]|nr:hypothetical protein [Anaerolineales bacterium]
MKNKFALSFVLALAILMTACAPEAEETAAPAPTTAPAQSSSSSSNNPSGYDVYPSAEPATAVSSSSSSAPSGAAATVALSPSGFLVDANGMTLYLYTSDTSGTSNCSGGCTNYWPPFTFTGQPVAGAGVNASLLGIITRTDGSTQVTYNGHPLYHYKGDHAAGDENGQGSGGVWYVVSASGNAMQ